MASFISSIGTAVPDNHLSQKELCEFMILHLGSTEEIRKNIELMYRASGINYRQSVIPDFGRDVADYSFFPQTIGLEPFPPVSSRMALYKEHALRLSKKAIFDCIGDQELSEITHLITVSCTGMYAPGLDIELIEELELKTDIQRTAINFMGCYAAFNALKVAQALCSSQATHKVLVVSVELCSIHLLKKTNEDAILSNSLFGDGAAAVLIESAPSGMALELSAFYADMDIAGKNAMGWYIDDFGFDMRLSSDVPAVIKKGISNLTNQLLHQLGASVQEIEHYAIHPGGKKILQVIEEELGISREDNRLAYEVLQNHGNMSSATVLFVLKKMLNSLDSSHQDQSILSFAFGPGLTMESMLLKIVRL